MGAVTKIEWTATALPDGRRVPGATFNPWRGCTNVSPGCDHCYAETGSGRNPRVLGVWGPRGSRVIAADDYWRQPLTWNALAAAGSYRRRVFCASLADVFEGPETMPPDAWEPVEAARRRLFELIRQTPQLDWLLLTKRPEQIVPTLQRLQVWGHLWPHPFPNVWLGVTAENQEQADIRIPQLLAIPATVRFVSVEPMLGPVDLGRWLGRCPACGARAAGATCTYCEAYPEARGVQWVICGGESGGGEARPMHARWPRALRDQCLDAGVPFFFKQHGAWVGMADYDPQVHGDLRGAEERGVWAGAEGDPDDLPMLHVRLGKHRTGRLLDDREWNGQPDVRVEARHG